MAKNAQGEQTVRSFLLVGIAIAPILLAGIALWWIVHTSRRFAHAESELIGKLQRRSNVDGDFHQRLRDAERDVINFLRNTDQDARPLIGSMEFVVDATRSEMSEKYVGVMVRILRHGSDRNRANYLKKLFSKIVPPSGQHTDPRRKPDAPAGEPAVPYRTLVPDRVPVQRTQTPDRTRGKAR